MGLLICPEEHLACYRYEDIKDYSVDIIDYQSGVSLQKILLETEIIVILKGSIFLSYEYDLNHHITQGKMILLPTGANFKLRTEEGASLFIFRLRDNVRLCESYSISRLKGEMDEFAHSNQLMTLEVNESLNNFLKPLANNLTDGVRCSVFLKHKIQELLLLLRAYYPKAVLAEFFRPVLSNASEFTRFVLQNYQEAKTVKELADMYSCSVSCLDKKFRKAFGVAPYKWMQERKLSLIYHEIFTTTKPIKQIAEEQRFKSLPQFNDYCKKNFGAPPGKMRKLKMTSVNEKK